MIRSAFVLVLLVSLLATAGARAQSGDAPGPAITAVDPAIDRKVLELQLVPLTRAELEVEIAAWVDLVRAKARELSATQIELRGAGAEGDGGAAARLAALQEERTALVDRYDLVRDALAAKGGNTEEHDQYIAAVSGLALDVSDVGATWTMVTAWLRSTEGGLRWAKNVGLFVATLLAAWIVGRIVGNIVLRAVSRVGRGSDLLREFLVNISRKAIYVLGLVVALSMLEVNIGPFIAALGVAGFVIGFAMQDTLSNFSAGVMILLYRPFDVGSVVEAGGVNGKVQAMTIVSTTITTPDNQVVIVPNSKIWGNVIRNITGNASRRVDLVFGIGYDDDIARAQSVLEEIVTGHELVHAEPAPVIRLHELADSSVNFVVRPWTATSDYWTVYWDLTRRVKERFDAEGISIPFPQRDVHVHQVESPA